MPAEVRRYLCVKSQGSYCRSPMACDAFGYCRERNFDGYPVNESEIARRRAESDQFYAEFRGRSKRYRSQD